MIVNVDVIIPTLNRLEFLREAVASIRAQTYLNWQLTIADNGSTDGTLQWLDTEGLRWVSAAQRGAGAARMAGIESTSNELIYFLDSDDLAQPSALQLLVDSIQNSQAEISYGVAVNQVVSGELKMHQPERATPAPLASTSILRRAVFDKYGGFDAGNFSYPTWYMAAKDAGLTEHAIDDEICIRRIHGGNVSSEAGAKSFYFDLIRARLAKSEGRDG